MGSEMCIRDRVNVFRSMVKIVKCGLQSLCSPFEPVISSALSGPFVLLGQFLCSWICSPLKRYLSVHSHKLLPPKSWKLVFLASEWVMLSPRSIQSCFPLLQGPGRRKSTPALFRSNWVKHDYNRSLDRNKRFFVFTDPIGKCVIVFDPVGSKKCWR